MCTRASSMGTALARVMLSLCIMVAAKPKGTPYGHSGAWVKECTGRNRYSEKPWILKPSTLP